MSTLQRSATLRKLSRRHLSHEILPGMPGSVLRGRRARGESAGNLTTQIRFIRKTRGDPGIRKTVPRQTGVPPSRPLNTPVFGMVDPGLPHHVICLAAGQARAGDQVRGRGMCPSGKLVPHHLPHSHNRHPGRSRRGKHRPSVAGARTRAPGSTPATVLVRGRYPGPLPG
jgi:hypothetical protein